MKHYKDTLDQLNTSATTKSHMTKLDKIKNATEDLKLKGALGKLVDVMERNYNRMDSKKRAVSITPAKNPALKDLITYCDSKISNQTPEWQIMAKRHGWIPPEN